MEMIATVIRFLLNDNRKNRFDKKGEQNMNGDKR